MIFLAKKFVRCMPDGTDVSLLGTAAPEEEEPGRHWRPSLHHRDGPFEAARQSSGQRKDALSPHINIPQPRPKPELQEHPDGLAESPQAASCLPGHLLCAHLERRHRAPLPSCPNPPPDGQGWQSFICSHSQLAEPLAEPLLSSSLVNPWGSSELKATLWHLPVPLQTPLSCTQAPALRSCSKAAALPSDSFFFCTPFGSRCNLPPY